MRISLRGSPGFRTGTLTIHNERWELASWHRRAAGMVVATTDAGQEVTFTTDGQGGGHISFGGRHWVVRGIAWNDTTMTGEAAEGVSDGAMAEMFGVAQW
jgi:hypothetical protein